MKYETLSLIHHLLRENVRTEYERYHDLLKVTREYGLKLDDLEVNTPGGEEYDLTKKLLEKAMDDRAAHEGLHNAARDALHDFLCQDFR